MVQARLSRMATGHIVVTIRGKDLPDYTRVVGYPKDRFGPTAKWVKRHFTVDKIGVATKDLRPCCAVKHGNTLWL